MTLRIRKGEAERLKNRLLKVETAYLKRVASDQLIQFSIVFCRDKAHEEPCPCILLCKY